LPVEEPRGDLELRRVLHDGDYPLELVRVEVASPVYTHQPIQGGQMQRKRFCIDQYC
jgi:hypothetical protein